MHASRRGEGHVGHRASRPSACLVVYWAPRYFIPSGNNSRVCPRQGGGGRAGGSDTWTGRTGRTRQTGGCVHHGSNDEDDEQGDEFGVHAAPNTERRSVRVMPRRRRSRWRSLADMPARIPWLSYGSNRASSRHGSDTGQEAHTALAWRTVAL